MCFASPLERVLDAADEIVAAYECVSPEQEMMVRIEACRMLRVLGFSNAGWFKRRSIVKFIKNGMAYNAVAALLAQIDPLPAA